MDKTKVIFYIEEMPNQVLAVFPEKLEKSPDFFSCYSHIDQHSAAQLSYFCALDKATPEQYKPLETELRAMDYDLDILNY